MKIPMTLDGRICALLAGKIAASRSHPQGISGLMMDEEIAAGGEPYPLPTEDWMDGAVVVRRGEGVRIVAVRARQLGGGALRRLVDQIAADGLRPVTVSPIGVTMPAIMKRWGWRCLWRSQGWHRVDEWRPVRAARLKAKAS